MLGKVKEDLQKEISEIREGGLYKDEWVITGPQGAEIKVEDGREVLNFCANNYLGLADHPDVIAAAHRALDDHGFGLASVRFICGTQDLHRTLEKKIAEFLGLDDAILYSSCFDANGGLFETILGEEDAVVSDVMRVGVPAVDVTTHLDNVQKIMQKYNLHALPVKRKGEVIGVVTLDDINRVYVMMSER